MYTERSGKQTQYEMVMLEELVPQNHLLRKIDKAIDFSFINKICKPYYCENNGRPAIEPEVLFRMLFIGYLYGKATGNPHLLWFERLLDSHFEGIIAHATYDISAGKIEGINNKIKTLRRQG